MFLVNEKPTSLLAEAYRGVRTSIEYSSVDKKIKTLLVTSAEPGEGKSTVCGNLAFVLSQGGKKVIIVDCDLRKPSINKKFKLSNNRGLTDFLIGKVKFEDIVNNIQDNLYVITSGNKATNPAEVVSSVAMEKLIEDLGEKYDYVILDTPPVKRINDGIVLSTKVDGVVYVVRAGQTKQKDILEGYKALEAVKANVIGSVLNGVSKSKNDYYYYYGE